MTRALVLLLAAAALTYAFVAPATGASTARPALKLVHRMPLEVQGVHFKLGERVRVTAASDTKSAVRVLRSTRRGTFTANLGNWDTCETVTVKAVGARGDRATLVVEPPPPVERPSDAPCLGL
jgi:hypothetical protein